MKRLDPRLRLAGGLLVIALVVASGTAIAASGGGGSSPSAFLDSLARHLGVSRDKLDAAAKAAAIDQVDAALAAGRITKEQADELKARIESGEAPMLGLRGFGGLGGFGHGFGGPGAHHLLDGQLSAAADYLDLTEDELRSRLADGKSLADIATAEGKSVDGLGKALVADAKTRLAQAVKDGRLTEQQAQEILQRYTQRVGDLVQGAVGWGHDGFRFGPGRGSGRWGPPGARRAPGSSRPFTPAWSAAA